MYHYWRLRHMDNKHPQFNWIVETETDGKTGRDEASDIYREYFGAQRVNVTPEQIGSEYLGDCNHYHPKRAYLYRHRQSNLVCKLQPSFRLSTESVPKNDFL